MAKSDGHRAHKQARRTRISAKLPVNVDGARGVTRDISTTGMFIIQSAQYEMGSHVDFWLDMDTPEGKVKLCCKGEVMRVEALDGKVGIGVKILSQERQNFATDDTYSR